MSRSTAPAVRAGLVAMLVHVGVGIPVYYWAFMSSYFMNDLPGTDVNYSFLRWGITSATISATVLILLSAKNPGLTWRVVAFAAGTSATINGAWLAFFFGTQVSHLGDDSGTIYDAMSTSTVWSIVEGCAFAAIMGLVIAVAIQPRRT